MNKFPQFIKVNINEPSLDYNKDITIDEAVKTVQNDLKKYPYNKRMGIYKLVAEIEVTNISLTTIIKDT